ncbi:divergent polysaccharide deacetylase family protein [Fredinandcohnia sp. 179-A 10B2 NHS]|uniref:divergent polysaccharide deacetylase family protein n=1 Tax=Fredinandcohnia sp. 179-A 10B2 NHS TaxID=3235176 RepID=UPI00399F3C97
MKILICFFFLLFSFITQGFAEASTIPEKELAIVIDDLGNDMKGTEEMLKLPIKLTVAIMPFMPTTKEDAELVHKYGHEVILHLPMEPKRGKKFWLGPGAITTDLSDEEVRKRVEEAVKEIPHIVGVNHHMGSKVTEDKRVMRIVLEVCKENGLFYLDSMTSSKSVVEKLAKEMNVPYLENDIFFDEVYTTRHISKQANLVAKKISNSEELIAIGHVGITGPKMVNVLKEYIPVYEKMAKIVHLSDLIEEYKLLESQP